MIIQYKQTFTVSMLLFAFNAYASVESFSVTVDNDGPLGNDKDYTNGVQFEFSGSFTDFNDNRVGPYPIAMLDNSPENDYKWRLVVGQKIWTPTYISEPNPSPNERPYAGLLFTQMDMASISKTKTHSLGLMLGITGPKSFAEEAQTFVHKITGSDTPNGWGNQIEEALVANAIYDGNYRIYASKETDGNSHEFSVPVHIQIGNFRSEISAGTLWRWGQNLEGSFGSIETKNEMSFKPYMVNSKAKGAFLFTGAETRYRFNDITIEGDRPDSTYQASIEHLQMSAVLGGAIYGESMGGSLTFAVKSKDFEQDAHDYSANVSATVFWLF
jgi:hypothetical protein